MTSFEINKPTNTKIISTHVFPEFVLNSENQKEHFNYKEMIHDLQEKTDLSKRSCIEIIQAVLKQTALLESDPIHTSILRDFICIELTKRSLYQEKQKFLKSFNKNQYKFYLKKSFIQQYQGKQPDWGPLGYITYKRTYARVIKNKNRTEEFFETIQRVVEGVYSIQKEHCKTLGLPWNETEKQTEAKKMFQKIWDFKFTPPGRGLWMMGTEFIDKHGSMALNNCGFCSTEDIAVKKGKAFEWLMDALMLGVGVGFDTKGAGKIMIQKPAEKSFVFKIPDSREGWVLALRYLLNAYFNGDMKPIFDYSKIRPAGEPISGFGGVASGPEPLKEMLISQQKVLENRIGQKITSVDIVDLMNLIGKCVVAGNVRRSAEIALGDVNDKEYVECKKDPVQRTHHRWASNNSVYGSYGIDYSKIIENIKFNGEPGIIYLDNARAFSRMGHKPDFKDKKAAGVNPCGEQTLESFELCCLVETFPSRHASYEEFQETLKYAYLYAKTVTLVNTHRDETNAVMGKNRRIGISQTGIIDAFARHGRREILHKWCDQGYDYLKKIDALYSDHFCIPRSVKITTVKPSGTVSLLPGVSPGIHYPHSEYYIRRIRIAQNSDLLPLLEEAGYHIESDVTQSSMKVIDFPIHEKNFIKGKHDATLWEQIANAIDYQHYWSDNQVSITVSFQKQEEDSLIPALEFCEDKLKGISLLPLSEHGYDQPPYEAITKKEYEKYSTKLKPLKNWNRKEKSEGSLFCDGDKCQVKF